MFKTLSIITWVLLLLLCLNLMPSTLTAGQSNQFYQYKYTDTVAPLGKRLNKDSVANSVALAKKSLQQLLPQDSSPFKSRLNSFKRTFPVKTSFKKKLAQDTLPELAWQAKRQEVTSLFSTKPFVKFIGGTVTYNMFYRTGTDTPYSEKYTLQHTLNGQVQVTLAGKFPVNVSWLARKSNSAYFRDIYDVKAEFDKTAFRAGMFNDIKRSFSSLLDIYRDSLTGKLYQLSLNELNNLKQEVESPFTLQRVIEMNEIIRIPALSYDASLPDSLARKLSDSAVMVARKFMETYESSRARLRQLQRTVDSLQEKCYEAAKRIEQFKQLLNNLPQDRESLTSFNRTMNDLTGTTFHIPRKYRWLMGIRSMGIGRNQLNYSELTAKNISVTGLNFEYNSWYYLAISAGLVDYRFRDFALKPQRKTPQHMYLVRLGLGQLNRNYFILSYFGGRKQLYPTTNASNGIEPFFVKGLAAEAKWQLSRSTYIIAEAAQSSSPDLSRTSTTESKFWDLSNTGNKAFSLKLSSYLPKTRSRLEAQYKFTGANYQSFTSFQTNAANIAWLVKGEQSFFKRQLKLSASLRSNEFSSPYILQAYSSNTVFKSLQATFRKRNWPMVSIGYQPASQFVKLENQLLESRFQALNASVSHLYKIGAVRASTTLVFNRFYNSQSDTGFVYFNAVNAVLAHNFFFDGFSALLTLMTTKSAGHQLHVLEAGAQFPFRTRMSFGGGAKVNNLNQARLRIGYYGNVQLKLFRRDMLYFSYERGYLAGAGNNLDKNDFLTVSFSKSF